MPLFRRYWNPGAKFECSVAVFESLRGSDLTIEWQARRDNTLAPDTAQIRIFNPLPSRARAVEELWRHFQRAPVGAIAELSIGWDGVTHQLMRGDITRVMYGPSYADRTLVIELGDGQKAWEGSTVGPSISGSTIADVLTMLITLPYSVTGGGIGGLGYILPAESRATIAAAAGSSVPYRGVPVGRSTGEVVRILLETLGLSGRVQNGVFWVMRGQVINRPGPVFKPSTGLLYFRPREDGGAQIEALGDPSVEPGIQVQVRDDNNRPKGAAVYRVEQAVWSGSTRGQSVMTVDMAPGVLL